MQSLLIISGIWKNYHSSGMVLSLYLRVFIKNWPYWL